VRFGAVVQPGIEFASTEVIPYKPEKTARLVAALASLPGLVFEAHSTDYQSVGGRDLHVRFTSIRDIRFEASFRGS
jgi:tagatose-1,6-bisphosphate aldolase non-catalytic subunit AgaZ/GatZ